MSTHNFEGDNSVSESNHVFLQETHALPKPTSASPPRSQPSFDTAAHSPNSSTTTLVISTSDDVFEVLRHIQLLYGSGGGSNGDEDFETIKEIERRFQSGAITKKADDVRGEIQISLSPKAAKSALAYIHAIGKNWSAQKHLRNTMAHVEMQMKKLKTLMSRTRVYLKLYAQMTRERSGDHVKLISARSNDGSAKGAMQFGPQENPRVANYRMAFQTYPQWISRPKWTPADQKYLQIGVVQQFQKTMLLETTDHGSKASAPVATVGGVEVNLQALKLSLHNIDWDDLASTYLPGRSGPECQARWRNHEDPSINRGQWVHEEDMGILKYVRQKGFDFVAIADALGTNRTPFACLARYQRSLNPHLTKSEWTPDEDAELTAAVQRYGEGNWTIVASALEGRTGPQCSNRWLKALLPSKQKKGRWEPHEDMRLQVAVGLIGKCWSKIAEAVPGRTQASCRDRWVNCLDPSVNRGKWTEEEDKMLEEGIRVHGRHSWTKVASCVPHRTDSQCRKRWMALFRHEVVQAQATRKLKKALLPSNFVDRESHRPTLEASDFQGLALEGGVGDDEDHDLTLAELKKSLKKRKRELKNGSLAHQSKSDGNVQDPPA